MRNELRKLKVGDRVLARWPDDGWYYASVVRSNPDADARYKVENKLGAVKYVYREDLIEQVPSSQTELKVSVSEKLHGCDFIELELLIKIGDTVVAQHPKFSFAFAPGEICRLPNDTSKLIVRFYDFAECLVDKSNVYRVASRTKFEHDVADIIRIENFWVGRNVFAFNTNTRAYEWGKNAIDCRQGHTFQLAQHPIR